MSNPFRRGSARLKPRRYRHPGKSGRPVPHGICGTFGRCVLNYSGKAVSAHQDLKTLGDTSAIFGNRPGKSNSHISRDSANRRCSETPHRNPKKEPISRYHITKPIAHPRNAISDTLRFYQKTDSSKQGMFVKMKGLFPFHQTNCEEI